MTHFDDDPAGAPRAAAAVVVVPPGSPVPALRETPLPQHLVDGIAEHEAAADAANTRRAYDSDWRAFERWCDAHGRRALPAGADTVAAYITDRAAVVKESTGAWRYAPSTISRWVTAINVRHARAELPVPGASRTVQDALAGIRHQHARPTRRMAPLVLDDLRVVLKAIDLRSYPEGISGHRDAALMLMGMVGAFRGSEIASRALGDVEWHHGQGLRVRLLTSKTDQDGRGSTTPLPFGQDPLTCPPCAFLRWIRVVDAITHDTRSDLMRLLRAADVDKHICRGPRDALERLDERMALFPPVWRGGHLGTRPISGDAVYAIVKRRLEAVGIDPRRYGSHSLRSGFVTQALRSGATPSEAARQGRWRSLATVETYRREDDPLVGNGVTKLPL